MVDLAAALQTATTAAKSAGDWLKLNQDKIEITKQKDIEDIQLSADLTAEKMIIETIDKAFPDHNIFSEEVGLIDHQSEYIWMVDPLDGTKEYLRGQRDFLTLVGLQDKKEVLAGCVYNPSTAETFTGGKDLGANRNGLPLNVSAKKELKHSIITMKLPNFGATRQWQEKVVKVVGDLLPVCYRVRSSTCDAANICLVALGAVEAFILMGDYAPRWYDLMPALVIAQESGATITNVSGEPIKLDALSEGIVITNGLIHDQLLAIINR